MLTSAFNVLLMVLGFGMIIAVHELGHFLAARWAGIRVHAFAIGFGSALCSWRKGLGFRAGSSEREYNRLVAAERLGVQRADVGAISPTEYRLNWFPFGGYVKMLGQEDLSPTEATSPDSFGAKPVWKRMVVISAGVVMNLLLAGVLFFIAFKVGIREPEPIVGSVVPGHPAERGGLRAGDRVISAGGSGVHTFTDLAVASALSNPSRPLEVVVQREGESSPRTIAIVPERGANGMYQIGALPAPSASLASHETLRTPEAREAYTELLERAGLEGVTAGMKLVAVNDLEVPGGDRATALPLRKAIEESGGAKVKATFADAAGTRVDAFIEPRPVLDRAVVRRGEEQFVVRHLAGLTPAMVVDQAEDRAAAQGIRAGDVIARVGEVSWPNTQQGIAAIRSKKGQTVELSLMRDGSIVSLIARVDGTGRIGFVVRDSAMESTLLAAPPELEESTAAGRAVPGIVAGSRVTRVEGTPVTNFAQIRAALRAATKGKEGGATVPITLAVSGETDEPAREETIVLELTAGEVAALHALSYENEQVLSVFEFAEFLDKAVGPVDAVLKGVGKTHNVIMMTYATFMGLFERTIPVAQLQGPVGITHLGSRVAERGMIYLIFFLGLISANLAVVNFLPLPITDGGHMVFLAIEGITRRPVSAAVQNVATMVGLLIIGTMFIVVTYHDIARLLGLIV